MPPQPELAAIGLWDRNHGAVVAAPAPPRVPLVATSVAMERSAMQQLTNVTAVMGIATTGQMTTYYAAATCKYTGGKRGSAQSDCKDNHDFTQQ
jgi:hypothetical protein